MVGNTPSDSTSQVLKAHRSKTCSKSHVAKTMSPEAPHK